MDRRHLVFSASFADDIVFSESGDIIVPAGRDAAQAVIDALNRRAYRCSEVIQRDYYGWEFRVAYGRTTLNAVLQRIDKWILTLTLGLRWKGIFLRTPTMSIGQIAENVAQLLSSDLPCDDVNVYSDENCPY
jgi:hypothetical protein